MRIELGKFHNKAKIVFDRENLIEYKQKVIAFVLDSKGHILTEGWNSYTKTHPIQKRAAVDQDDEHKCFMHAEVHALTRLYNKNIGKQNTIIVLRLNKHKELMPGKPCVICRHVINNYGIENIIHS
jgi:tRNA(Arg) A34 adenosine deaminase TadA